MSNTKRKVARMWWDIKDVAFVGTNISKKNGMFMSMANAVPVGSVYAIKKNLFGALSDENLVFSQKTLAQKYPDFPPILSDSAKPPTQFTLDKSNETSVEVLGSLIESSQIADISAELSTIIKSAKKLTVKIEQWGIDYIEEGELSLFFTEKANANDARIKKILSGENYVATRGIWIKGLSFSYDVDQETIARVKAILETKKSELANAHINLGFKSELELDLGIEFNEKIYPFFKFRQIRPENKADYAMVADASLPENDVFLEDVNFAERNS